MDAIPAAKSADAVQSSARVRAGWVALVTTDRQENLAALRAGRPAPVAQAAARV
jgi:hypothetical protein